VCLSSLTIDLITKIHTGGTGGKGGPGKRGGGGGGTGTGPVFGLTDEVFMEADEVSGVSIFHSGQCTGFLIDGSQGERAAKAVNQTRVRVGKLGMGRDRSSSETHGRTELLVSYFPRFSF
jgi:hypothetical protein